MCQAIEEKWNMFQYFRHKFPARNVEKIKAGILWCPNSGNS